MRYSLWGSRVPPKSGWTITLILNDLDQKSKFIAIVDDLLIYSTKQEHWGLVKSLMKAMI